MAKPITNITAMHDMLGMVKAGTISPTTMLQVVMESPVGAFLLLPKDVQEALCIIGRESTELTRATPTGGRHVQ
jgi:hypothetical protein